VKNFDALAGQSSVVVREAVPHVRERVTVTPLPAKVSSGATHVLTATENWTWSELRDYVIREIELRHGAQPRDPRKEKGIFSSFLGRWPDGQAVRIAKAAFEVHDGWWANAPIGVNRFCKGSDPFFAERIITQLER
jgi:hypothetical protein